jgi:hypothetical protein
MRQWQPSNEKCPGSAWGTDWHQPVFRSALITRGAFNIALVTSIALPR